ncbi:cytochrome P450 CYP94D108-like [Corylus avellana]|uniref:cytochrome P450 CYP94D108-like n=1 Tax=Corylus avellana TaxID=13451 RepID=UPI001E1F488C|nr:cytochrome P450 CYP94D108-like [Corylus avellana]
MELNSSISSNPLLSLSLCFFIPLLYIFIFSFLSNKSQSSPSKTPCPQSYPIIGNLVGLLRNRHRFHDWVADMLSQTPSSTLQVRTFLDLSHGVCTANPTNVDHFLHSNFQNYIKGSRFHNVLSELLGDGIFNVDAPLWTLQRKIASHEFKTNSLKHFISDTVASEISTRLIPFLSAASDGENRVIDLQDVLQRFAFDNICHVAFGVNPACLVSDNMRQNTPSSDFAKAFDDVVEISSSRFLSPLPLLWKLKRFLNMGSEKRYKEAIEVISRYAMDIIRSKEQDQEGDQDLLSRFMISSLNMEFQDEEHKRKFLRDIVISFILAGRDTTSTALTWFFWLISGHPRCARLIHAELSAVALAPAKEPRIFSYDELKKLHYLHAALSESMRLFPPVPINSRLTVDDDVLPDGTHVGKGWFADYSAYAMGRMERVWGEDCREFRPERWLGDDGAFQPSDQNRFPVFHCGPRICLGKEMAYLQMKSVAAAVMNEFDVVAVDGGATAEKMMNPPYTLALLLKMRGGLPVKLIRRELHTW